jgi:hypothetical protein
MASEAATTVAEPPTPREATDPVKAPDVTPTPAETATAAKGTAEKPKKAKKGKAVEDAAGAGTGAAGPSVAAHPRAARSVAQAKGWGALGGFLIGGYFSLPSATLADAGLRALLAGIVCYMVAWAASVFAWRRIVMIEIKAREQQLVAQAMAVQPPELQSGERARAA